jgi:hypothetical protein
MNLNDLLTGNGIDPKHVLVLRHRPHEPELRKVLPWLVAERPDLFNAYQSTQAERVEGAMARAAHVAAFIGHQPGKALFVGIYSVKGSKRITRNQFWQKRAFVELKKLGMKGFTKDAPRSWCLWFHLKVSDFYADWKGKLVIGWPGKEVGWWRWADRNKFPILAIHDESALDAAMPAWDAISVTWEELSVLPTRWKSALSQWRGIYYIFDSSDGKGYVGAAYGSDNILGRWLGYAKRGHGGNRLLRQREPRNFRFTIMQRVSPDMEAADVIRVEASWKERLHTRAPLGLNDN